MFDFPKRYKVNTPTVFRQLFKSKTKIDDVYFDVYVMPNELKHGRIGFAIPKASILKATARNRIKRVGRDFFRHNNLTGFDILFVAKKYISELSNLELVEKLKGAWERIKIS